MGKNYRAVKGKYSQLIIGIIKKYFFLSIIHYNNIIEPAVYKEANDFVSRQFLIKIDKDNIF